MVIIQLDSEQLSGLIIKSVRQALKETSLNKTIPVEPKNEFFTVNQAAKFLNLTKPTIYSKVSRGELPYMKRGKRLYFSKQELTDYIKTGRGKTNAELEAEAEEYLSK